LEHKISANTRLDALLTLNDDSKIYVELKNVTMSQFDPELKLKTAYFPDAITERGQKHIVELKNLVSKGHRAKLIFIVQRTDCHAFRPATQIDPIYSQLLYQAHKNGVEISAYKVEITPRHINFLNQMIPIHF
jgi:sugar fermentation stimulation protein A